MMYTITDQEVACINSVARKLYMNSVTAGWWVDKQGISTVGKKTSEKIALIHSEVSEAFEAFRKDKMDDHLTNRKGMEVELADAVIRIFDLVASECMDIGEAMREKVEYNKHRADHKAEARNAPGGKKF